MWDDVSYFLFCNSVHTLYMLNIKYSASKSWCFHSCVNGVTKIQNQRIQRIRQYFDNHGILKTTLIRWMKQWLRGNKTVCLGRGIRTRVRSLHSKMFLRHCFRFNICTYHLYLKKNCGDDSSFSCGKVFMWSRLWHETIYSVFFVMLFDKVCTQICNNNIKRDK